MHINILRVSHNKDNPYVMINKNLINDERISWKAKGLAIYLLSKPDDWQITISNLVNHSTDGKDAVASGLKELEKFGYLVKSRVRTPQGCFTHYEYILYEYPNFDAQKNTNISDEIPNEPEPENPAPENPVLAENPVPENPPYINNNNINNIYNHNARAPARSLDAKKSKKDYSLPPFQKFYELYPRKKSPDDALKAWKQRNPDEKTVCEIYAAIEAQKRERELQIHYGLQPPDWKYPATWLRAGAWKDQVMTENEIKTEAEKLKKGQSRGTNSQAARKGAAETPLDRARRIRAERRAKEQSTTAGNVYEGELAR